MDFKGYAVGGLAVGEPQAVMLDMLDMTCPRLPADKPRYLMGVGTPDDILKSVARGIDMFDCVMPTRAGRHGLAYTRRGKVNLRNARHADDPRPLDEESDCPAARDYSRAYLHHLVQVGRGARRHAADLEQPRLLPAPDAGRCATRSRQGDLPTAPPRSARAGRGAICRRCELSGLSCREISIENAFICRIHINNR